MAPYLLFGLLVAGLLRVFVPAEQVGRHLGGQGWLGIFKASFFGIPLPLCSCGVLPTGIALHRQGATKGATVAFLISTPQTGIDSIMVTYAMLGPVITVARPLAALVSGVLGGLLTEALVKEAPEEKADIRGLCGVCGQEPCQGGHSFFQRIRAAFSYGFGELLAEIALPLLGGLIIATLVAVILPPGLLGRLVSPGLGQLFLMVLAGLPLYMCSTASVPLAYALLLQGLSPGAALVFLMCGPATNTTALSVIGASLGLRALGIFLASIVGVALASGYLLDRLFPTGAFLRASSSQGLEEASWGAVFSAFLLLGLLSWHLALKIRLHLLQRPSTASCSCSSSCCSSGGHSLK